MPRAVRGQNGLKTSYFAISCPWGSGRPKQKTYEKLRNFGEKLFGRPVFSLKGASSTGKLHFFCFLSGFSRSAKGQNGLKTSISRFPATGGPVGQIGKCKKVARFWGETFGASGSPPKMPLARGNCVFMFSARVRNFSSAQGQNGPKYH